MDNDKSTVLLEDKSIFPDFPAGPLKTYRDQASFCHKKMCLLLEGVDHIRLKVSLTLFSFFHLFYVKGKHIPWNNKTARHLPLVDNVLCNSDPF